MLQLYENYFAKLSLASAQAGFSLAFSSSTQISITSSSMKPHFKRISYEYNGNFSQCKRKSIATEDLVILLSFFITIFS